MRTDLFDFDLPESAIALYPAEPRDQARLLVVHPVKGGCARDDADLEDRIVRDLPSLLRPGDALVLNDTKVLPARLVGRRAGTGGKWEGLYLGEADGVWELLAQTRGYAQPGERFVTDSGLTLELVGRTGDRHWRMRPDPPGTAAELLVLPQLLNASSKIASARRARGRPFRPLLPLFLLTRRKQRGGWAVRVPRWFLRSMLMPHRSGAAERTIST